MNIFSLLALAFVFVFFTCVAMGQGSMDNCIFHIHFGSLCGLFNMFIGVVVPQLNTNLWLVYVLSTS